MRITLTVLKHLTPFITTATASRHQTTKLKITIISFIRCLNGLTDNIFDRLPAAFLNQAFATEFKTIIFMFLILCNALYFRIFLISTSWFHFRFFRRIKSYLLMIFLSGISFNRSEIFFFLCLTLNCGGRNWYN